MMDVLDEGRGLPVLLRLRCALAGFLGSRDGIQREGFTQNHHKGTIARQEHRMLVARGAIVDAVRAAMLADVIGGGK